MPVSSEDVAEFSSTEMGLDFWYGSLLGMEVLSCCGREEEPKPPQVESSSGLSPIVKESSTKEESHSSSARSSHCHSHLCLIRDSELKLNKVKNAGN